MRRVAHLVGKTTLWYIAAVDACVARCEVLAIGNEICSVLDPEVGFIARGGRDPVVDRRPSRT